VYLTDFSADHVGNPFRRELLPQAAHADVLSTSGELLTIRAAQCDHVDSLGQRSLPHNVITSAARAHCPVNGAAGTVVHDEQAQRTTAPDQ